MKKWAENVAKNLAKIGGLYYGNKECNKKEI